MSLHQLANHMSAQGRGPDSTLVHMSPREVSGLQSLAMAHGGTLTINPETGLPEAGFLDSLMPTLLGGAATFFSGGAITPFMAALGVGGLTALTSKDLGKGLMAGLGAYGGSGIVSGLAGLGTGAMSAEAGGAAVQAAGVNPFGLEADMLSQSAVAPKLANASYYDKLAAGASKAMSNPGDALSAFGDGNKFMGAAKLAGPVMAAFSAVDEPKTSMPEKSKTAFIRSFYKDPVTGQKMANPAIPAEDFGNRTLGEQYFAANGGLIALAGGGQTAYDYLDRKRSTSSDAGIVVDDTPPKPRLPPLGSDGKGSYTYNKDSKTWVWTPTAKPVVPVNPGVATLMDTGGGGRNDGGGGGDSPIGGPPNYAYGDSSYGAPGSQNTNIGFLSGLLGNKGQMPAPIEDRMAEQDAKSITEIAGLLNGLTTTGADIGGGQFAGGFPTGTVDSNAGELGNKTPTTTSGIASLGSGISPSDKSGGTAPTPVSTDPGIASLGIVSDRDQAIAIGFQDSERDREDAAKVSAVLGSVAPSLAPSMPSAIGVGSPESRAAEAQAAQAQADREAANRDRQVEAQRAADSRDARAEAAAREAQSQANREASFSSNNGNGNTGASGEGCVDPSTLILLANGTQTPVGKLKVGDFLHTLHEDTFVYDDFEVVYVKTVQQPKNIVTFTDGHNLTASDSHKFLMSNRTWKRVDALEAGDTIETAKGVNSDGFKTVAKIEAIGLGDVVKLTIDNAHTYVSEGLVSHNKAQANGGMVGRYSQGGLGSLGGYSDGGRLLRGPGDGVSDSIPATIGDRQPARLANNEFVIPARIVSEIGNGSTDAGAKRLYQMMDRIQNARKKSMGKGKIAVDSKAYLHLPA